MTDLATIRASLWAITPQVFDAVQSIMARHAAGESADLAAIEAKLGRPLANASEPMKIENGVAVISLDGVLTKRINMLSQISGGTSTQVAGNQLAQALNDPSVTSIVLAVDSPGGTVDGCQSLADAVKAARGKKPITAAVSGTACSAAIWVASAADKVFISGDTDVVGSVGVIAAHTDVSAAEAARGIKTTEVVAGKFKNATSSHAALGATGREVMQAQVDQVYGIFLGDLARNRGTTAALAHEAMGDGRVFIGRQAIHAGLVDGVKTLDTIIREQAATAQPAKAVAAKPALSAGDIFRRATARVAEARALGFNLNLAAAIAAVTLES